MNVAFWVFHNEISKNPVAIISSKAKSLEELYDEVNTIIFENYTNNAPKKNWPTYEDCLSIEKGDEEKASERYSQLANKFIKCFVKF